MLPNCKGYEIPGWTSALLCWDTVGWKSSLWRQAEGKPGRSLLVISLTLSWTEAEEAGALSLCTKPPPAHSTLLGAYTSLSIQLPVEITWQHMVPAEIRKREREFSSPLHRKSFPPLLLLSTEVLGHLEIWNHPQAGENTSWHWHCWHCWIPFSGSFKLRCTLSHKASWGKCAYAVQIIGRTVDSREHSKVLDRMCAGTEQTCWDLWEEWFTLLTAPGLYRAEAPSNPISRRYASSAALLAISTLWEPGGVQPMPLSQFKSDLYFTWENETCTRMYYFVGL